MSEHISFESLAAFAGAASTTAEVRQQAAAVNAHLLSCPECGEAYDRLLELAGAVERLRGAPYAPAAGGAQTPPLSAWHALREKAGLFLLNVQRQARRLLLEDVRFGASDFGHPLPAGARAGGAAPTQEDQLVDNENSLNELSLSGAGLHVRLDAMEVDSPEPFAALVLNGRVAALQRMVRAGNAWTADFEGLESDQYLLVVQ